MVINLLSSHPEHCSGWASPHICGQHHIVPSSACRPPARPPKGPRLRSPGLFFWTCSASSRPDPEDPHGFAPACFLLPPVLMFLPVPLRRAQFKSLFFFYPSLVFLQFNSPPLSLPLLRPSSLHPFPSFPAPRLSLLATPRVQGRWTSSAAQMPANSNQLSGHFPASPPPSISVYLDPSLQIKARSTQRCQQQRPSHFQVYLGFIQFI